MAPTSLRAYSATSRIEIDAGLSIGIVSLYFQGALRAMAPARTTLILRYNTAIFALAFVYFLLGNA
jgi:hypothetical protein